MQCSAWHWLPPRFTKKHSRHFLARGMHAGPGLVRKHKTASGYPPAFFYPSLKFEKQEKNANLAHPTVMGLDAILRIYFFRSVSNPACFSFGSPKQSISAASRLSQKLVTNAHPQTWPEEAKRAIDSIRSPKPFSTLSISSMLPD
jgi:hypothetical protein